MSARLRTAGIAFWNLSGTDWCKLKCEVSHLYEKRWITWKDRVWLRKSEARTLNEIAGYQIAEALKLPVQPWVSFFELRPNPRHPPSISSGILVERWPLVSSTAPVAFPAKTDSDLVCRALALTLLMRGEGEEPQWLLDEFKCQLRLFELDGIGAHLRLPPQQTAFADYRKHSCSCFDRIDNLAHETGLRQTFRTQLRWLCTLNFQEVLDFSGHPYGNTIESVLTRAFNARQRVLTEIADLLER